MELFRPLATAHFLPFVLRRLGLTDSGRQKHLFRKFAAIAGQRHRVSSEAYRRLLRDPRFRELRERRLLAALTLDYEGEEAVACAFMGENPDAADNRWLREAMENRVPVIYFLGVAPGLYQAIVPACVIGWDARALKARVAFGMPAEQSLDYPATAIERRYAPREVKQRLHQDSFREAVISAYDGRCAVSGLPEQRLLDAAHIIADRNEPLGQAIAPNGIPLSKIHHAAFDAHLIGIDPDFRVHVAARLLKQNDGPMLEVLKKLHDGKLHLPARRRDWPDQERLALRFDEFRVYE